jgi:CubicO group peptidase (beta-lactamase class C family)
LIKKITEHPSYSINTEFNIGQDNWDDPDYLAISQGSMENLFKTVSIESGPAISLKFSEQPLDINTLTFTDPIKPERQIDAATFLNRRLFNDSLLIMFKGEVIHESYRNGMEAQDRHVIHSCSKSLCAMIAAMAIDEGKLDPTKHMSFYIDEFRKNVAWDNVSVQHVLDMQAGLTYSEDYRDPDADYWSYARAAGYYPPLKGETAIGAKAWAIKNLNRRSHAPGTVFAYNSTLTNVLGMALENIYGCSLAELFQEKLYKKVGAETDAYFNTDPQGFPITEGQFNCTLRDFAKLAYVMINQGKNINGEQIIPASFIDDIVTPDAQAQVAYQQEDSDTVFPQGQYKNKFWALEPEKKRFTMLGIHGQTAWFDLTSDLMIITHGSYPKQDGRLMMSTFKELWQRINDYVTTK